MKTYHWNHKGFTLAEMAVVVLLIGIAMTMGLKMVTATLQNTAISETKAKQERIKIALIGFLRTNGRLPCPDIAGVPSGTEPAICNATAAQGYGVIPWTTLNMSRNDVLDGWGNYFTYRVANRRPGAVMRDWTTINTPRSFNINELTTSTAALTINELNAAGTALVATTTQAVVVILSHGRNGFGAETIKGNNVTNPPAANIGERTNNTATTPTFVKRPYTESSTAFNGPIDDMVEFMTPQDLLQPLIDEKSIKTCKNYCPAGTCPAGGTCTPIIIIPIGAPNPACTCIPGETLP